MGQAGKAGRPIARRGIAVAMGKTDEGKGPENLFPVERVAQGWATLDKQAKLDCDALLEEESVNLQSQIGSKTE